MEHLLLGLLGIVITCLIPSIIMFTIIKLFPKYDNEQE